MIGLGKKNIENVKNGANDLPGSTCNRAYGISERSVQEAPVLDDALDFNLFQIATEDFCVNSETEGSELNQ